MSKRLELDAILREICPNVYFQTPESYKMTYPAIRYKFTGVDSYKANNGKYVKRNQYTITLMDKNPDSVYVDKIMDIPYCSMNTMFVSDGLNHFVFTTYI